MFRFRLSYDLLVPTYIVGVVGALLQISGGIWDVSSHIMGIVETFFTVPHLVLYSGVLLCLVASLTGVVLRRRVGSSVASGLFTGLRVSLVGGALQVVAGPFDLWWHSAYGFDPHLFTPSHSLLITGLVLNGVGMGIAATRLVQAGRAGTGLGRFAPGTRWLELLALVALILARGRESQDSYQSTFRSLCQLSFSTLSQVESWIGYGLFSLQHWWRLSALILTDSIP